MVLERGEERGKSDSTPRLLSSPCRLRDKRRDKAQREIIFRAGLISRAIEERKWGMSSGGLGSSHRGSVYTVSGSAPRTVDLCVSGEEPLPARPCLKAPARRSSTSLFSKSEPDGGNLRRDVDEDSNAGMSTNTDKLVQTTPGKQLNAQKFSSGFPPLSVLSAPDLSGHFICVDKSDQLSRRPSSRGHNGSPLTCG